MQRRIGAVAVVCAGLAMPASAAAATKTVYDGPPPAAGKTLGKFGADVNAFFLPKITIKQGDTVKFVNDGFHNVDIPPKGGSGLDLVQPGQLVSGVNDAAGKPFWFNGKVPSVSFNSVLVPQPGSATYNGSKRVLSGLPIPTPKAFKVKFTKTGVFKYFCDVHPGMVGEVVVRPTSATVPTAKQDAAALAKQVAGAAASARKLVNTKPGADQVSIGASAANGTEVYAMFPSKLKVKVGTVVRFSMSKRSREDHTATFGPTKYVGALANAIAAGNFPANSVYPSDPTQPLVLNSSSHGNGFANTGFLDTVKGAPFPSSGRIRFSAPGTYTYICLIHPFMKGTVVVTR